MDIETEADLYQRIDTLEAEKYSLTVQIKQLENGLEKEKKFHRKFVEDVIQSEETRNIDFEKQRKELLEDNKRLAASNRQLTIDKNFYKTAYDSLMKDEDSKKPKAISKLSEKTFEENKKLKIKNTKLTRDNASLRLKVKQLENFKNKVNNNRIQQEANKTELQNLFNSTRRTNGDIFNEEALSKLGELSKD